MSTSPQGDLALATRLAEIAHQHAALHPEGGAGLCLPVAAAIGCELRERDIEAVAHQGTFDGEAHWWVELHGKRIDPTRHQFDDLTEMVYPGDDPRYVTESTHPCLWTREQVGLEARRVFAWSSGDPWASYFSGAADLWSDALIAELAAYED